MATAALLFALGEKKTSKFSPGDLFWKIVKVNNFNLRTVEPPL